MEHPLKITSFADRLTTPEPKAVERVTTALNQRRGAIIALRSYHELLASPNRDLELMSEIRGEIDDKGKGDLQVGLACKVEFSDTKFIPKHGKEFSASKDYRGFLFNLRMEDGDFLNVIYVDSGSREAYQSRNNVERRYIAATAMATMGLHDVIFMVDDEKEKGYKVETYLTR